MKGGQEMSTKPEDSDNEPETGMTPERALMEKRVAMLLSIIRESGEVSKNVKVATVTTSHPDDPTRIKLELTDGSELELAFRPRGLITH